MASIIKNEAQVKALAAVEAALNEISVINDMILILDKQSEDSARSVQLIVSGDKKPHSITVDSNHFDRISSVLKTQRAKRIATVDRLSKKNRIAFNEKELDMMSEKAIAPVAADIDPQKNAEDLAAPEESSVEDPGQEPLVEQNYYHAQNDSAENKSWHYQNDQSNY